MLDYAQIKAGKFRKNITSFDVKKTINNVLIVFSKRCSDQGIYIKADLTRLGNEKSGYYIQTDEDRLKQVLFGLISNSVKFTRSGGITINVSQTQMESNKYITINVVDTGVGIPIE